MTQLTLFFEYKTNRVILLSLDSGRILGPVFGGRITEIPYRSPQLICMVSFVQVNEYKLWPQCYIGHIYGSSDYYI
ncbi:hypothetical protein NC651_016741 [Populus alba x Populus x berolinensis]|nr:hypothetical protein NC651_016741 [Populus alba x Populus x berolinensis]